jgi:hypothetical protein
MVGTTPDSEDEINVMSHWIIVTQEGECQQQRNADTLGLKATVSIKQRLMTLTSRIDQLLFGSVGSRATISNGYLDVCMQMWAWNDASILHGL